MSHIGVYTQPADLKGEICKVSDPPIIEALVERKIFLDTALKSLPPPKKNKCGHFQGIMLSFTSLDIYRYIHMLLMKPLAHNPNFTKPLEFVSILASPGPVFTTVEASLPPSPGIDEWFLPANTIFSRHRRGLVSSGSPLKTNMSVPLILGDDENIWTNHWFFMGHVKLSGE